MVLLAVSALLLLVEGVGYHLIAQAWREEPGSRLLLMGGVSLAEGVSLLLFIATAVTFSIWVYRAIANLPALGSLSSRFTPSQAVWAFYVPFANLVRGPQVMATIWRESQPPLLSDAHFLKPRSAGIVTAWAALWVGGFVLSCALSFVLDDPSALAEAEAFFKVVRATAAILCLVMVHRAEGRQREQAVDLERRAGVPRPTGMELR
jgi:hypothetical protein